MVNLERKKGSEGSRVKDQVLERSHRPVLKAKSL